MSRLTAGVETRFPRTNRAINTIYYGEILMGGWAGLGWAGRLGWFVGRVGWAGLGWAWRLRLGWAGLVRGFVGRVGWAGLGWAAAAGLGWFVGWCVRGSLSGSCG